MSSIISEEHTPQQTENDEETAHLHDDYSRSTRSSRSPSPAVTRRNSTPQLGTYAMPPPGESYSDPTPPDGPDVISMVASSSAVDVDITATLSPEHTQYLKMQSIAFIIKLVSVVGFLFSIYSYVIRAWWLLFSFGWLFNPVGFYGAHTYQRRFIIAYVGHLLVDLIFQFAYMFVTLSFYGGPGIILSIFFIMVEGYFTYYVFQFYKQLPRDGMRTFQRFVDAPPIAIQLQRVEEE